MTPPRSNSPALGSDASKGDAPEEETDEFFSPANPTPPDGTQVVDLRASHPPELRRTEPPRDRTASATTTPEPDPPADDDTGLVAVVQPEPRLNDDTAIVPVIRLGATDERTDERADQGHDGPARTDTDTGIVPVVRLDDLEHPPGGARGDHADSTEINLTTTPDPPTSRNPDLELIDELTPTGQIEVVSVPDTPDPQHQREDDGPPRDERAAPTGDATDFEIDHDDPTAASSVVEAPLALDDLGPLDPHDGAAPPPELDPGPDHHQGGDTAAVDRPRAETPDASPATTTKAPRRRLFGRRRRRGSTDPADGRTTPAESAESATDPTPEQIAATDDTDDTDDLVEPPPVPAASTSTSTSTSTDETASGKAATPRRRRNVILPPDADEPAEPPTLGDTGPPNELAPVADTRPTGESGSLPDDIVESAIPSGFPLLADPPSAGTTARFDEPPPAPLAWAGASGGPADQLDVSPSERPTGGSDNADGTTDSIGWAQVDPEPAPDNSDANDLSGLVASPQERDATDNHGLFDDTDLFGWESGDSGGADTSTREPSVEAATELFRSPTPTDDWQPLDDITAAGLSAALVGGINFESDPIEVGEDPVAADATADDLLEHSATEHAATEHEASGAAAGEPDATGAEAVDGDVLDHHVHDLGPFDEAPDDNTTDDNTTDGDTTDGDTTDGDTTDGDTLGNTPESELNSELEAEAEETDVPAVEVEASADRAEPDQLVDGPDDDTDTAERDVIDHDEPTTAVVAADDRAVVSDSPMVLFPDDYPHTAESEAVRTDDDRSFLDDPTPEVADPDLEPAVPDTMSLFDDYVPSWVEPTPATEALPVQPGPEAEFISLEAMLAELPTASPAPEKAPVDAPVEASTNPSAAPADDLAEAVAPPATPVTEVVPLVEPVAAPDVIDLAELPEEPGLTSEPLVAVAALSAVGRTTAGSDRAAGAAPPLPPTGRHDAFAELADLDGTEGIRGLLDSDPDSDDHVDSHDWWDFGDVSQRDDDRGGFRAAADATEAIEFSPTEQVRLGPGDLAAPPTASKASDLDSLGGPESKTYEDALHAFFDSPADRDPADGDTGDRPDDVAPGRKTPDLFQTAGTDLARASDELDEVDRWVEDTEDTHGDWLERTKRTTLANLMGALMALLAVVGLVLATVWVVNNL